MEYVYTQNPTAKKPIILVDKYIGKDAQGIIGIDGGQFAREILALKNSGKTEIEVWINSKGGNISDGFNIYGSLKNSDLKVTTVNMGAVDSTAGWIYQAGDHRVWMNYSLGLIHNVQGAGKHVDAANLSVATMLSNNGKKSVDDCLALMASDTIMNASLAQEFGFCDEVRNSNDILNFTNSSDVNEIYTFGQKQTVKLLPKNKSMEALNQILGLQNEASLEAQVTATNKIVEARNEAVTALATRTTELTTATNALTEVNGKLLISENALATAVNENKKIKATAMVNSHVGVRIANEPAVIEKWVNAAIVDFDGTVTLIKGINAVAPKTDAKTILKKEGPITSVADYRNR